MNKQKQVLQSTSIDNAYYASVANQILYANTIDILLSKSKLHDQQTMQLLEFFFPLQSVKN